MNIQDVGDLVAGAGKDERLYVEVVRVPALSVGVYRLPIGRHDGQQPHTEDEIYYVLRGSGTVRVGDEDQAVMAGTLIYVPAGVPHHFHTITDDLAILVVFAPAEYTAASTQR